MPQEVFAIAQLDPAAGISFCGDAEAYLDALRSFEKSIESRSLLEAAKRVDWEALSALTGTE